MQFMELHAFLRTVVVSDIIDIMEDKQIPWWGKQKTDVKANGKKNRAQPFFALAAFGAILAGMIASVAFAPEPSAPRAGSFNSTMYPANVLATIGQCGETFDFEVPQDYVGKIPDGFFDNENGPGKVSRTVPVQPMIVPVYGYFYGNETTPAKTFWKVEDRKIIPKPFEYLRYMWDGWTIIWYEEKTDPEALASIKQYVIEHEKVMAIPWYETNARPIPLGRSFAFGTWGVSRSCDLWDSRLADEFIDFSTGVNLDRKADNPPNARLDVDGELYNIEIP